MYTVQRLSCSDGLSLGSQVVRSTLEEAVDIACEWAAEDGYSDTREEIEADLCCTDEYGDHGIFIGECED